MKYEHNVQYICSEELYINAATMSGGKTGESGIADISKESDDSLNNSDAIEQKDAIKSSEKPVAIHTKSGPNGELDFILGDVIEKEIVPCKEFLAELTRIGWTDFAYYEKQKTISFTISRQGKVDEHDGNNLTRYVNCVRRYINSRNEVLVLDFIPNHEQKSSAHVVHESGEACLINEIRIALNGVLVRQIRGNMYELHAINTTPGPMDVMTSHITRHGSKADDAWHGDFAPTVKLGQIEPGSELHISMIYMKSGRVFTNELAVVSGNEVKMPPDRTCFLHNGFTKYEQPDMIDNVKHIQLRNPMISAPGVIRLELYPQPYIDPRDIVIRALNQLIEDLGEVADHINKSRTTFSAFSLEKASDSSSGHYAFGSVSIAIQENELISRIHGFDESIGCIIASNAGLLDPTGCSHNSSHSDHPTKKETVIRITAENSLELYARATDLAINRTKSLVAQFANA